MTAEPKDKPSVFDRKDPHPERKVRPDPDQAAHDAELDEGLRDTFPASDPPSTSQPTTARKTRAGKSSEGKTPSKAKG
ncbi:MAG: hypothetical protein R3D27_01725 [Hyphomicrobiaceae bacterium]